jgi:uncharacterized DUF497 family protein
MLEFDWDEGTSRHLRRHRIREAEFEEAAAGETLFIDRDNVRGENRWIVVGAANDYRIVVLVYVDLGGRRLRPITGWDAPRRLRERYHRRVGGLHG